MPRSVIETYPARLRPEIEALETSGISQLFALGVDREGVIPLWFGEGDLPTPDFICATASQSLKAGNTFYSHKRGIPALREAIVAYMNGLFGAALDVERITVTSSGMNGIMLALQTIAGAGDSVVVVSPVWPNIMSGVRIMGATLKTVSLQSREDGFHLDMDELTAACDERTRAVFVNSPSNPTGWVMGPEDQRTLLDFCRTRGIWIMADEVYHRFVYERPASERPRAPSFLDLVRPDDAVIVVQSFSKTWAMTGWRMGWLVHPAALGANFDRLVEFNTSGAPRFLQDGCITALNEGEGFACHVIERCRQGRDLVYQRLSALPRIRLACPEGAFYAFFAVEGLTDSLEYAKQILGEVSVGLAPGSAFGPGGEGHLRLCFAGGTERLSAALDRLTPLFR
jgi:aspartate/methionine/tyrosine aminotransferase